MTQRAKPAKDRTAERRLRDVLFKFLTAWRCVRSGCGQFWKRFGAGLQPANHAHTERAADDLLQKALTRRAAQKRDRRAGGSRANKGAGRGGERVAVIFFCRLRRAIDRAYRDYERDG